MKELNNDELSLMLLNLDSALKNADTPVFRTLNIPAYQNLLRATAILELISTEIPGCGQVEVSIKPERSSGEASLAIPSFDRIPLRLLREITEKADQYAVFKSDGGKQRFCVSFRRLFFPL